MAAPLSECAKSFLRFATGRVRQQLKLALQTYKQLLQIQLTALVAKIGRGDFIAARFQILNTPSYSVGAGSFSFLGALIQNCGAHANFSSVGSNFLGNNGSATARRFRTTSSFIEAINVTTSGCTLRGVDITGVGSDPMIRIKGVSLGISIQDVVGSTGNTGVGLELAEARMCKILMGTFGANTFTATAGQDIAGAGPVYYVHADYIRTNLRDEGGNEIVGLAGAIVGPTTLMVNDGNANIGQYKICRMTGSSIVRVAQADSAANASGIGGVSQSAFTSAGPQKSMLANGGGTWLQFDAAPTAGNIAYLSTATAGNAQDTVPAVAGSNRKIRLGRIMRVSGTLGFVAWGPEVLSVLADGAA